jgi:DNA-binding response OmpR family regulator
MNSRDHAPSILIVDRSRTYGWRLCRTLLANGAKIHIFHAFEPALRLLRTKRIDTAVVEFDADEATLGFCREAEARSVALVYSPAPLAKLETRAGFHSGAQRQAARPLPGFRRPLHIGPDQRTEFSTGMH